MNMRHSSIAMTHISFDLSPKEAIALQKELANSIRLVPLPHPPKTIAGVDVSLERFGTELFAGIIVLSFPDLTVIEHAVVKIPVTFPYIPGLLSFREIPGLLKCFEQLKKKPDILMVDGQGIAHPRRLGIATHLGLVLDIPTIGCAKSRLYGTYVEPETVGETAPITDPKTNEIIGTVLKSKVRSNPLIVSPGHKITVEESIEIVKQCLRGYRLPEPTRLAHELVNRFRKGEV
jgi:deoxyribonuclease V